MKNNKIVLIFSGYNQRAIISFMRVLAKNNVKFFIVAKDKEDPIFNSVYKENVFITRKNKDLLLDEITSIIENIKKSTNCSEILIAPSTEYLNRFLLKNINIFIEMNCVIPLVKEELYSKISDKYSFQKLCEENGIRVPSIINNVSKIKFPVVIKSKKYTTEDGKIFTPQICNSKHDLEKFLKDKSEEDFYFQEYVEGKSIYLLYYFSKDGKVYKCSQENLVQQPGGKSMVAAIPSDFHKNIESTKYEQLFVKEGFFGLIMVEVRQNKKGVNYMIEANPRFWGPSQLFVDLGINLFTAMLKDFGYLPKVENKKTIDMNVKYYWNGGIREIEIKKQKLDYYKYSEKELFKEIDNWLEYDIYKRQDTMGIYESEVKNR